MAGDVLFFALSATVVTPRPLLVLRLLAGVCSPLVPALAFIFEVIGTD